MVENQIKEPGVHKLTGSDGINPQVMRGQVILSQGTLSVMFEKLWWSGAAHVNWKKANVTHNFRKGKEKIQTGQRHLNPWEGNGKKLSWKLFPLY